MMKLSSMKRTGIAALAMAAATVATPASAALTFQFDFLPGTSAASQAAFVAAGQRWSTLFSDNITLRLTVGARSFGPEGEGVLAQAGSNSAAFSFNAFKAALGADATSADDARAVASQQAGNAFSLLINKTSDNPNGSGSATPFLDDDGSSNNSQLDINTATAKALGLIGTTTGTLDGACLSDCDAFIEFNTDFAFDLDPTDGIGGDQYDFIGIATHEIGHALGFVSGVDTLDACSPGSDQNCGGGPNFPFDSDQFTFVTPLDLFRFSTASTTSGAIDFTADTRTKYFSLDGGVTSIADFSTGTFSGDGSQASHWKDNRNIGILDPTAARGERLMISANDIRAFDAIGWSLASLGAVPEPSTWAMMISGFGLIGSAMRRRTKVSVSFA
jgi:hypothetical protein